MKKSSKRLSVMLCAAAFLIISSTAFTQMNNEPYSFNNAPGAGMSVGGKQAILNEKIFGQTPDNLVRGPSGQLLDVTEGPGHSAIVSYPGNGRFIPGFKGADFRGGNTGMAAGAFNSFFTPSYSRTSYAAYSAQAYSQTGHVVSSWTSRAVNGPAAFTGTNSIESWTGMVHSLPDNP